MGGERRAFGDDGALMIHASALFRLLGRPVSLLALLFVPIGATSPFVMFGDHVSAVQQAIHLGLTLPRFVGAFCSVAADGLLKQPGSWVVPHVGRSLAIGEAIVMFAVSAVMGIVGWHAGGVRLALCLVAISPFWFSVGGSGRLVAKRPKLVSAIGIAALAIAAAPAAWLMRARWSRRVARMRATVMFACNVVETLLLWCSFAITYFALRAMQALMLDFMNSRTADALPPMLVASIALTPILQWPRAKGPIPPSRALRVFGYVMAYVVTTSALSLCTQHVVVPRSGLLTALAMFGVIALEVQLVQYVALQRVYGRAALVAALS